MINFGEKVAAALYGHAIGDAMGAPVEGWPPERIAARFSGVRRFLPPTHGGDPAKGKGGGRITDDTLMAEALIRSYQAAGTHLDAHGYEAYLLAEVADRKVWVPEWQAEVRLWDRLWLPEKFPLIRLRHAHADPRTAGVGNCVNCGVAMWTWPVGAVNAGDPEGAYQEAAAVGLAHNYSFAVEAGAVMAAAAAAAFGAGGRLGPVLEAALALARDGTAAGLRAALAAVDSADSVPDFIGKVRAAVAPYDSRTDHTPDDKPLDLGGTSDVGGPSRLKSIEELPVALAALEFGAGDFERTIHAGVFYGRDGDSTAGMAGALFGATFGLGRVPRRLRRDADKANRRDFAAQARAFVKTIRTIAAADRRRFAAHARAVR